MTIGKSVLKSKAPTIKISNKREIEVFKRINENPGRIDTNHIKDGWDRKALNKLIEKGVIITRLDNNQKMTYFPSTYSEYNIKEYFRKEQEQEQAQIQEYLKRSRNRQIEQLKSRKLEIYNEEILDSWTADDIRRIDKVVGNTSQLSELISGSVSLLPKENDKVDIFIKMIIPETGKGYNLSVPERGSGSFQDSNIRTIKVSYEYDVEIDPETFYDKGTITYNIHLDYDPIRMKLIEAARKLAPN